MLLHIITGYFCFSVFITEVVCYNEIGTQEYGRNRVGYYLGGVLLAPFAVVIGVGIGIVHLIKHGVD